MAQNAKVKLLVDAIRSNHPDKGGCKKLPWCNVTEWVGAHQDISGGYNFSDDAYRKWHGGKDVTTTVLATVQACLVAHVQRTSREVRAEARAEQKKVAAAQDASSSVDEGECESPPKRRRRGPGAGASQTRT